MVFPTCYSKSCFSKSDVSRFGSTVAEALHLDRIDGRSYVVDTPLFGNLGYYVNGHDAAACDDTVNYDVSRCATLDKSSSCQRSAVEGSPSWLSACKLGASYFLDGTDSSARRRRQERDLRSRLFANICFDTNDSGAASSPLGDGGASALSSPADASVVLSDSLEEDSAAAKPSAAGGCASTSQLAGNVFVTQRKNDMNCQFSSSSPGNHNASFKKAVDPHCIDVIDSSCVNDSTHRESTSRPVSDASSSVTSSLRRSSFRSGYFDRSGIHVPGGGGSDDMSTYCVDGGGDGFAQLSSQEMRANAMRQAERGTVCLDRAEFPAWLGCKNKTTLNVRYAACRLDLTVG